MNLSRINNEEEGEEEEEEDDALWNAQFSGFPEKSLLLGIPRKVPTFRDLSKNPYF